MKTPAEASGASGGLCLRCVISGVIAMVAGAWLLLTFVRTVRAVNGVTRGRPRAA